MYLLVLISLGVTGIVAYLTLLTTAIRRARFVSLGLLAVLCGLVVYAVGYQLAPEQGFLLGAGLVGYRQTKTANVVQLVSV
jgi:hypothetical protein